MFSSTGIALSIILLIVMCAHIWIARMWKNSDRIVMNSKEMRYIRHDKKEMVRNVYMKGHIMACFVDVFLCIACLIGSDMLIIVGIAAYFAVFVPSFCVGIKYETHSRH